MLAHLQAPRPRHNAVQAALIVALLLSPLVYVAANPFYRYFSPVHPALPVSKPAAPLLFEPNVGQTNQSVGFLASSSSGRLFFRPSQVVMSLTGGSDESRSSFTINLSFLGTDPGAMPERGRPAEARVNYLLGDDPARWHTGLPTYSSIIYRALYPSINLAYDGSASMLKGTYTVAPNADPAQIRWRYDAANAPQLDTSGNLIVTTGDGRTAPAITEAAPVAWQEIGGRRVPLSVGYRLLSDGSIGFTIGEYSHSYALVIDPTLVYSNHFGGSGNDNNRAIALDAEGNVYLAGATLSSDFPTVNPYQDTRLGTEDGYITKLSPDGATILYSTYFGGSGREEINGIAVDGTGIYIGGSTGSSDFPIRDAIQPNMAGGGDGFVTKLNLAGSDLVYSTYLGGSGGQATEYVGALAIDPAGNVYVTGQTSVLNFPTHNAIQPVYGGGSTDSFVTKINAAGSAFVYSTYLGGGGPMFGVEQGEAITADSEGNAYVVGFTDSDTFPTHNALQPSYRGGETDGFVVKLNAAGSAFVFSTYLGGLDSVHDEAHGVAVDGAGDAYVTGLTSSNDFPTHNPYQAHLASPGQTDAFVTVYNSDGSAYIYSTYLGGSLEEGGNSVAAYGNSAYVTGSTRSDNFPLVDPLVPSPTTGGSGFLARIPLDGSAPIYSTRLPAPAGYGATQAFAVAVDRVGDAFVSGIIIRTGPFAETFVMKISGAGPGSPTATPQPQQTASATSTATATVSHTATPPQPSPTARSPVPTATGTTVSSATVAISSTPATPSATSTATPTYCAIQFPDVPEGSTFYPYIRCLACRGVVAGYEDSTFRPNNNITRGQLAKIVSNSAGYSEPHTGQTFIDVPVEHTFYIYIERLAARLHINGYPCGGLGEPCDGDGRAYFRPFNNASRGQIAKIVSNAAGYSEPAGTQMFQDVPPDSTFYECIERLASRGYVSGYTCGGEGEPCVSPGNLPYFRPFNNATRGQTSKIVANSLVPACAPAR